MAAVERNLLHGLRRDDMADGGGGAIDERHFRANEHRLRDVANGQAEVTHQRAARVDVQCVDTLGAKTRGFSRHRVDPIGDRGDVVTSLGIRADGHVEADRLAPHADHGTGNECSGRIEYAPLQYRKGLRSNRDRGAQHQRDDQRRAQSGDRSLIHVGRQRMPRLWSILDRNQDYGGSCRGRTYETKGSARRKRSSAHRTDEHCQSSGAPHGKGRIRVPIAASYPLGKAAQAHRRLDREHVLGRMVLQVRRDHR